MKGLIIKDFKMMKHESIISFIIPILFFIISLFGHNAMYFSCFSVMMFALVPTLNIANDEKYKWDKYEAILPIKKEHIVLEKYIIILAFVLPIIAIETLIICFIKDYNTYEIISLVSLMLFLGFLTPTIILPLYFLFGYNTSRIAGVPLTAIIYTLFLTITMKNSTTDSIIKSEFLPTTNTVLYAVAGLVLISISILISITVYKKKEF